ncbi:MAG: DNA mismatch repair protein MutL, partial [Spirochaetia bacterium]|nr:DNA mismatch repair protein MutL [Spirochaetia bacterium]
MGKIQELDPSLINKIAAGEVIESAQSVVKELVENSLDANASKISIEAFYGGLSKIIISDNGKGFEEDDLEI